MQRRNKKDLELLEGETLLDFYIRHTLTEKTEKNIVQALACMNGLVFSQTERKKKKFKILATIFYRMGWKSIAGMRELSSLGRRMLIS